MIATLFTTWRSWTCRAAAVPSAVTVQWPGGRRGGQRQGQAVMDMEGRGRAERSHCELAGEGGGGRGRLSE